MKLKVNFELPIAPERTQYIEMIARLNGWSPEKYPDISISQFVCNNICVPQVRELFRGLIFDGLISFLGTSRKEEIKLIKELFESRHSVTAEIVEE